MKQSGATSKPSAQSAEARLLSDLKSAEKQHTTSSNPPPRMVSDSPSSSLLTVIVALPAC
jgi:hypothetical protein